MPGAAYNSLQNPRMYEDLKAKGFPKQSAARISNARTPGHSVGKVPPAFLAHKKKRKHKRPSAGLQKLLGGK